MESQERDNSTRTPEPSTPEPSAPEPSAPEPSAPEYDNEHKIKNDAAQSEKLSVDSNQKDSTAKEGDESTLNSANGEGVGHALHSSASGNRDKSNLNGEIVFEAKKKKSKISDLTAPDSYSVTFTVSIAMATPTGEFYVNLFLLLHFKFISLKSYLSCYSVICFGVCLHICIFLFCFVCIFVWLYCYVYSFKYIIICINYFSESFKILLLFAKVCVNSSVLVLSAGLLFHLVFD